MSAVVQRDENGRLLPGSNLNPKGRPVGSKHKFTEDFLRDFHQVWRERGMQALQQVAAEEPAKLISAAVSLIPKEHLVEGAGENTVIYFSVTGEQSQVDED